MREIVTSLVLGRVITVAVPFSLLQLLTSDGFYHPQAELCGGRPTLAQILNEDPDLSLTRAWSKNAQSDVLLNFENINVTIFMATDPYLAQDIANYSKFNPCGPQCTLFLTQLATTKFRFIKFVLHEINAQILHNAVKVPVADVNASSIGFGQTQVMLSTSAACEGRYSVDNFAAVPNVVTILGMMVKEDFSISVGRDSSGQLVARNQPQGVIANILDVKEACNGWFYKVDRLLVPSDYAGQINSPEFTTAIFSEIYISGSNCPISLPNAMASIPDTKGWLAVWRSTGMYNALR